jgi:hypothetical protein
MLRLAFKGDFSTDAAVNQPLNMGKFNFSVPYMRKIEWRSATEDETGQ